MSNSAFSVKSLHSPISSLSIAFTAALLLLSHFISASITINVRTEGLVDRRVSVVAVDDYLSDRMVLFASSIIPNSGKVSLTFDLKETRAVKLRIGHAEGVLYVEPNKSYSIAWPTSKAGDMEKFDKVEVDLIFEQLPTDDLNALIRQFNADYALFVKDHYYDFATTEFKGSEVATSTISKRDPKSDLIKRKEGKDSAQIDVGLHKFGRLVDQFKSEIDRKYEANYSNAYFHQYVRYSIAELELVSGVNKKELYHEYFMSQRILHRNPSYMRFFQLFYTGCLTGLKSEKQELVMRAINADRNADDLLIYFQFDSLYTSETIRNEAMILGLRDLYNNRDYVKPAILEVIRKLENKSQDSLITKTAVNINYLLTHAKQGATLDAFTLLDEKDERWESNQQSGKFTYYFFFSNGCTSCIREMLVLEKYQEQYARDIDFVAISMDENQAQFKKYLGDHRTQKFTFLQGQGDALLREKFNLRSIPYAVLIDPDGKFVADYTRKPSEGVQLEFDKIVKKLHQPKQGNTWRD
jgi:thiol-disulfide isomerase/thioredoxin